ncbi:4-hydroxy-tetrahydrodipicolinate synthase [uncultured Helicobacter sp.]|uniref:4-hydroxy-tetrahydrodipicolinate synthase n=1 Tax=uncultured Helicobacter sp. TaxID=175537 RepID=UPI002610C878|nr:4-hydroxy-tetrahydrodipicolinate synthase [uncultured Helicobacter sp.]
MIFGAMSALVTPFKHNRVDFEAYEALIKRQIRYGMDACVPVGTTGESATLSHKEHMECIESAVSICKGSGVKVVAGAGSNATSEAIELAQFAQKCGADAILCVTPYYNKPTHEGLYEHYKAVADAIEIPVMLYNVPSRTGVGIEIETAKALHKDCANIYAIKEAAGLMDRIVAFGAEAPNLAVFSGEDMINFPILANNGKGVISVTGNLMPKEIADLTHFALNGDMQKSYEINTNLYEINKILFCESNPIPIKAAMFLAGLLQNLEYRLPLVPPSKENMAKIQKILEQYEVQL